MTSCGLQLCRWESVFGSVSLAFLTLEWSIMWTLFDPRPESGTETERAVTRGDLSSNEDGRGVPSTKEHVLFLVDNVRSFDGGANSCLRVVRQYPCRLR